MLRLKCEHTIDSILSEKTVMRIFKNIDLEYVVALLLFPISQENVKGLVAVVGVVDLLDLDNGLAEVSGTINGVNYISERPKKKRWFRDYE